MIFQGQELLEDDSWQDEDPIDWSKRETYTGITLLYRDLIALRRNRDYTTAGLRGQHVQVHHVNNSDKVLAFHRWASGGPRDSVIVVVNLSNQSYGSYTIGMPRGVAGAFASTATGRLRPTVRPPRQPRHRRPSRRPGWQPCAASIGLGPYSAVILSQDD